MGQMATPPIPGARLLVVDDEPNIVELARLYLEAEGYRVIAAGDGREALSQVEAAQPALLVLDLMLPQLDGWEVCRRLRAVSDLPIIMLTARSDDVDLASHVVRHGFSSSRLQACLVGLVLISASAAFAPRGKTTNGLMSSSSIASR